MMLPDANLAMGSRRKAIVFSVDCKSLDWVCVCPEASNRYGCLRVHYESNISEFNDDTHKGDCNKGNRSIQ